MMSSEQVRERSVNAKKPSLRMAGVENSKPTSSVNEDLKLPVGTKQTYTHLAAPGKYAASFMAAHSRQLGSEGSSGSSLLDGGPKQGSANTEPPERPHHHHDFRIVQQAGLGLNERKTADQLPSALNRAPNPLNKIEERVAVEGPFSAFPKKGTGKVVGGRMVFANRQRILSEENQEKPDPQGQRRSEVADAFPGGLPGERASFPDKQSEKSLKYADERLRLADRKPDEAPRSAAGLLLIRIESSFNNPAMSKVAGLHRIEIRDREERNLPIESRHVSCSNCSIKAETSLSKLFEEPNTDPSNEEDNWNFLFSQRTPPEIRINTSEFTSSIGEILIWNHRPSKVASKYPGVKAVTIWLSGKVLFSGELEKPNPDLQNQELVTRIKLSEEILGTARRLPPPLQAKRPQKGSLNSTERQSGPEDRPDLKSSPSDKQSASPSHTVSSKLTRKSQNFQIAPNFHNSDEESVKNQDRDHDSGIIEPDYSNRPSDHRKNLSNEASKDRDPQRLTATNQERSLSKVSRSSQESKRKNGPRIANSNVSKKFFEASPTLNTRGISGIVHQDSLKLTPAHQITKNRFGSGPVGLDFIVQTPHHSNRGQSSDKAGPLKADHNRKVLFSGQSTSSIQGPTCESQFNTLVNENQQLVVCNLQPTRLVKLELYTNWGDHSKIGLSGIELFDQEGKPIRFPADQNPITVTSKQRDKLSNGPQSLKRLLSTDRWPGGLSDPWVTDYDEYHPITIEIFLPTFSIISLIRIWNYSANSACHTSRSVKNFALYFDRSLEVFGELPRPTGDRQRLFEEAEWIFFIGEHKSILKLLDDNDWIGSSHPEMIALPERGKSLDRQTIRPATGEKLVNGSPDSVGSLSREKPKYNLINTPGAKGIQLPSYVSPDAGFFYLHRVESGLTRPDNRESAYASTDQIDFVFHSSWNGGNMFGIRAIELYDGNRRKIKVGKEAVRSDYQTVSGEFGFLFAGDPILKKKEDMWTAYLRPNAKLTVSLGKSVVIQTIVFYNFCSVSDDCTIGVKDISIKLRNEETFTRQLYPCPSEFGNNIRQEIQLKNQTSYRRMNDEVLWKTKHPVRIADLTQTNLPPIRTFGQFVRIRLVDNYGDKNYIGLNGLEIYDSNLSPLLETAKVKFQLAADPVMASAKQTEDDFRVPENLYNGKNDTANRELVWMAPYINRWKLNDPLNMNRLHNQIAIFFERPVDIAAISFWNYTRDPKRGARQAEIFVDECLVCSDYMLSSEEEETARTVFIISRVIEPSAGDKLSSLLKHQPTRGSLFECSREVVRAQTNLINMDITILAGLNEEGPEEGSRKSKANFYSQGTPIPSTKKNEFYFG